ncbi:hypothetical protein BDW22DRAFT_1415935 [Trametopsis cervina]|nr:hypothetical protein BDW22DRAFT_1415935 [Trametopsis cervina]
MNSDSPSDPPQNIVSLPISKDEGTSSVPCGICRRQFSKYTCPKCNLQYCSLICFRSQAHSGCSEGFYKNELETDIRTNQTKNSEERRQMMELLKRFEEEAVEDENALLDSNNLSDDDQDDLAQRISTINVDDASYDQLWDALTPAERQKFLSALNDPSSEVAQSLLASESLSDGIVSPWWEGSSSPPPSSQLHKRYGHKPQMLTIPPAVLTAASQQTSTGPSLLFNILAVLIAYSYVTRSLSSSPLSSIPEGDPEYHEAKRIISSLVPFLTDRRSKIVLPSLSGLITDLWSRFESEAIASSLFALLMRDAATLLRPAPVVAISESVSESSHAELDDHPAANALLALSDLSALFAHSSRPKATASQSSAPNPTVAKLAFYAARIVHTPSQVLHALVGEVAARAKLVEREGTSGEAPSSFDRSHPSSKPDVTLHAQPAPAPRIEELS